MKKPESKKPDIELIQGENTNILLIAPHAVEEEPSDDIGTADLTRQIQAHLKCAAVINTAFRKPTGKDKNKRNDGKASLAAKVLNLNIVKQAKQVSGYIDKIEKIANLDGLTYVFWIHGISDDNITEGADCFIGYGQPNQGKEERFTAEEATINDLIKQFQDNGIKAVKAPVDIGYGYRGWNKAYMNQWFRNQKKGLDNVQSIQLEFKKTRFRRKEDLNLMKASYDIAKAISALVKVDDTGKTSDANDESKTESRHPAQEPVPTQKMKDSDSRDGAIDVDVAEAKTPAKINDTGVVKDDDPKVEEAYQHLNGIIVKHLHNVMLDVGEYLIDQFYDGDYETAQNTPFTHNKSLKRLFDKLETETSGNAPKKSWLYNSIKLAIAEKEYNGVSIYGKLGHSHKICLVGQKNLSKEKKIELMGKAVEQNWTVLQLQKHIKEEKEKNSDDKPIDLFNLPPIEHLIIRPVKELDKLEKRAKREITVRTKALERYQEANMNLGTAIKKKAPTQKELKKAIKDNEWTLSRNNVNFSTGCSNACLYCYGRYMPRARELAKEAKEQGKKFKWSEPTIRQDDINAPQSLKDGKVGFPTSHDIYPANLEAYLTVLGKLLRAGNDIMIITKPVPECIKAICQASRFFKDKILFRFTIGGKSEDVLNFWEPNAPSYEERIKALKYAYDAGFETSVSMEPMLEFPRAEEMVQDFMPFVTDAIWFGKMNHIPAFKDPHGNLKLKEELAKVEAGHADENIKQLHKIYKGNPKIKWKLPFKEILGIPLPPAPGMDV